MGRSRQTVDRGVFAVIAAILSACVAWAKLTPSLAQRAASEGVAMADRHGGYNVRNWVAYQSRDPLRAVHGQSGVDAVIVETPFERVRYEAYLHRLQGDQITPTLVHNLFTQAENTLGILIYAHSKGDEDRGFLAAMQPATLTLSNGIVNQPSQTVRFGPSDDFYDVGDFRESRWVGSVTYRYALPQCAGHEVVRLNDGRGETYMFPYDATRFQ